MTPRNRSNFHFGLGLGVMVTAALGMQVAKANKWLYIIKKPLPIRKPLRDLDRNSILPYDVVELAPLSPEMVEELGTKEYINWILKAPGAKARGRNPVDLAITYYTDVQDQVPHVPEECYFQGGNFTPAGDETLEMKLDALGETVPIRRLGFYGRGELVKRRFVYYTLCINGALCSNRNDVRLRMADRRDTHLYYSKVEIAFDDVLEKQIPDIDAKARELFDKVLPALFKSHWPLRGTERGGMPSESK